MAPGNSSGLMRRCGGSYSTGGFVTR